MKKLKQKDTRMCQWCKKEGVKEKAAWYHFGQCACNKHKEKINVDDGYMSEADYQTWGRL
jgi:hypothetical protein